MFQRIKAVMKITLNKIKVKDFFAFLKLIYLRFISVKIFKSQEYSPISLIITKSIPKYNLFSRILQVFYHFSFPQ